MRQKGKLGCEYIYIAISPFSSLLGTFHLEERLHLNDRNSMLMA